MRQSSSVSGEGCFCWRVIALRRVASGFTLLELLVAMALLSLLVVMLMGIVDSATKLWRVNESRVETYREARAALALMASDFANFHPALPVGTQPSQLFLCDTSTSGLSKVGFLAVMPNSAQDTTDRSQLCTVGFFLARGRTSDIGPESSRQTWNLYRYFLGSNETLQKLRANPASPNLFPAAALQPREQADPPRTEILARNIQSFTIRPLVRNGPQWEAWTQSAMHPWPELLEIEVVACDEDVAKRFDGDVRAPEALAQSAQIGRRWLTRVALPGPVTLAASSSP